MDNTTQQPNTQDQTQQMPDALSPTALAATLAHATHLHEQLLPKPEAQQMPQTPSQTPQNAPGQELGGQVESDTIDKKTGDLEGKIDKKLEILRDELKGTQKVEIDSLKKLIQEALAEDNGEQE